VGCLVLYGIGRARSFFMMVASLSQCQCVDRLFSIVGEWSAEF